MASIGKAVPMDRRSEGAEIASSRIFEKFNNAQSDVDDEGEEIND